MRIVLPAEFYESPATAEDSEIILNPKLHNTLELKARIKKLLADYLDLPESANLEESLDIIYTMEEEIDDLQVKFKILISTHCLKKSYCNCELLKYKKFDIFLKSVRRYGLKH
ncbi:hypothetical protein AVEN_150551-1 [Araneus ventricosus]|uniref:Uncharacterized protein n=1 Tax=Araneus ventricosus TaxID=182803 RepID=A0A4Y2VBK7_ARAVE|nr:hypothetical protein AVEN_150551-1 [Araneus ventricosus]